MRTRRTSTRGRKGEGRPKGSKRPAPIVPAIEEATDHPNAQQRLRNKASRQRRRAYEQACMAPAPTLEGFRRAYITKCRVTRADLASELEMLKEAFREIQRLRDLSRADQPVPHEGPADQTLQWIEEVEQELLVQRRVRRMNRDADNEEES